MHLNDMHAFIKHTYLLTGYIECGRNHLQNAAYRDSQVYSPL